jgi:hypothetical protein
MQYGVKKKQEVEVSFEDSCLVGFYSVSVGKQLTVHKVDMT